MSTARLPAAAFACVAALAAAAPATAEFTGWIASARSAPGDQTIIDVYAGFNAATDKLLNVFNMNMDVNAASIVQSTNTGEQAWKPLDGVSSTSSLDSFVTVGGYVNGNQLFASSSATGDPSFTNYNAAGATTIPSSAGWYNSNPISLDVTAMTLAGSPGFPAGSRDTRSAVGQYGTWVAHLLVNKALTNASWSLSFTGWASYNGGLYSADARIFHVVVPAPGAFALVGLAAMGSRRRRTR